MGEFAQTLTEHGVELDGIPLEAPWQLGKCERRGGLFKEIWRRVVQDCQVEGITDSRAIASIVNQVLNETENIEGFSPAQWVLGTISTRVPGNLLIDEERAMLEVQEAAVDPASAMAR